MKKIFLILITIILLIGIMVCIIVMKPKEVSTIIENTTMKVGELNNTNLLTDNTETSNDVTISNGEIENSMNESENKETEKNTNTLTNTTSKNKTEDKNRTNTKAQTSLKPNKESKKTEDKTTTTTSNNVSKKQTNTINTSKNTSAVAEKNDEDTKENKQADENHKHSKVGTSGMWVKSVEEIVNKWDELSKYYEDLLEKKKITWEEYCQSCPTGYYNVMHCVTNFNCKYITWDWQYAN